MATDRLADWIAVVDGCYPEAHAAGWDNTGLQVGDPEDEVHGVLVCLDVTEATIDDALAQGADLILAHHPLLFRPLERLTPATASGRLALRAARAGVAIVAAHTNFDVAHGGTTDPVMAALDVHAARPLVPQAGPGSVKVVTFVPAEHTDAVLDALAGAGAGVIGQYDHCSYRLAGTGTFRPSAEANPTTGERGRVNEVTEDRLEVVVPRDLLGAVVAALVGAHPYEEVAYDVYPLVDTARPEHGHGRVGALPAPLPLRAVADRLAAALPAPLLRVAGDLDRLVSTVAACGGAGDSLIPDALRSGADLYVTGDLRHHVTLDAVTQGMALIDAGHYATEAAALPSFRATVEAAARDRGLSARLLLSAVRTDPWAVYRPEGGP
jgi:dinuclear metal center YbgI/SA1388 family protein